MVDKRTLFMGDQAKASRGIVDYTDSATLAADDANKLVRVTKATAATLTLPPNASVEIPVDDFVDVMQGGAGAVTVTAGSGVTLRNALATAKPLGQYGILRARKIGTNEWVLSGNPALS